MIKKTLALLFLVAATLSQNAIGSDANSSVSLSEAEKKTVKEKIRSSLKDPESAKFGAMYASKGEKGTTVCGYVNAKNSFGGYTGEQPYIGLLLTKDVFAPIGIGGGENESAAIREMCRNRGIEEM